MTDEQKQLTLARAAKSAFNGILGIHITALDDARIRLEIDMDRKLLNGIGSVHGGCIFALCDSASSLFSFAKGAASVTSSANIQFLRTANGVNKLIAEAHTIKTGASLHVNSVEVTDENATLIAVATVTQFVIGPAAK